MKSTPSRIVTAVIISAFFLAASVSRTSADTIFVSNTATDSIEEIVNEGAPTTFIPTTSNLDIPTGLAVRDGILYVDNYGSSPGKGFVAEFSATTGVFMGDFTNPVASPLYEAQGIAFDSAGNLFAVNSGTSTVEEFNSSGTMIGSISTYANFPSGIYSQNPYALAFDNSGNLYVTNTGGNNVEKITFSSVGMISGISPYVTTGVISPYGIVNDTAPGANSGKLFTVNGSPEGVVSFNPASGPTLATLLSNPNGPRGITVDTMGDFYVSDNSDNTVTEYFSDGTFDKTYPANPFSFSFDDPTFLADFDPVPEPSTCALLTAGLGLLFFVGRRKLAGLRA